MTRWKTGIAIWDAQFDVYWISCLLDFMSTRLEKLMLSPPHNPNLIKFQITPETKNFIFACLLPENVRNFSKSIVQPKCQWHHLFVGNAFAYLYMASWAFLFHYWWWCCCFCLIYLPQSIKWRNGVLCALYCQYIHPVSVWRKWQQRK